MLPLEMIELSWLECLGNSYLLGRAVTNPSMAGYARFADVTLSAKKLGGTRINTVLNTFAGFASPRYGLGYKTKHVWMHALARFGVHDSALNLASAI